MKLFCFYTLFFPSLVMAGAKFNHVSCFYYYDDSGWHSGQSSSFLNSFELAPGQSKFLAGLWTSEKPTLPNFAACTLMRGIDNDNAVLIENHIYSATQFDALDGNDQCVVTGSDVKVVSKNSEIVQRGSYSVLETEWLPPGASRIQVREYIPKLDELDNISEMAMNKCHEIVPVE